MDLQSYKVLRVGKEMLRDCWLDVDNVDATKKILVVRQVRFKDNSEEVDVQRTKITRFSQEEVAILKSLIEVMYG